MESQLAPLLCGARSVALLDGQAHLTAAKARRANKLETLVDATKPLLLLTAEPEEVFDSALDTNYFVLDPRTFALRNTQECVIIDVSPHNKTPRLLKKPHLLYDDLRGDANACLKAVQSDAFEIAPRGTMNSVLLGWLLEYPVLYFSSSPSSNCLVETPLRLISMFIKDDTGPFSSFSVPECLMESEDIQSTLGAFRHRMHLREVRLIEQTVTFPHISL